MVVGVLKKECECLANIFSFGKFKTTQHIHWQSRYFGKDSQLSIDSSILNFSIEEIGVEVESGGREKFQQMLL